MFGIGTSELIIILIVTILILGPNEIPRVARTLGKGLREIQRAKDELKKSIEFEDEGIKDIEAELKKAEQEIHDENSFLR